MVEFIKDKTVVVIGGIVDNTGVLSTSITVCTIEQVGEKDLMVKTVASKARYIIPKDLCIQIDIDKKSLDSKTSVPAIGDMVFYQGKINWRDKEEVRIAGTIYEIEYAYGTPVAAKIHHGTDMVKLPFEDLMVLQKNSS